VPVLLQRIPIFLRHLDSSRCRPEARPDEIRKGRFVAADVLCASAASMGFASEQAKLRNSWAVSRGSWRAEGSRRK
jgi:hypothetical protein